MKVVFQLIVVSALVNVNVLAGPETFSLGIARPAFHKSIRRSQSPTVDAFSPLEEHDELGFDECTDDIRSLQKQQDFGEVSLCAVSITNFKIVSIPVNCYNG